MDPRQRELKRQLQEAYDEISQRNANRKGKSLAVFLVQSIFMSADEGTLERMLKDAKDHIKLLDTSPMA